MVVHVELRFTIVAVAPWSIAGRRFLILPWNVCAWMMSEAWFLFGLSVRYPMLLRIFLGVVDKLWQMIRSFKRAWVKNLTILFESDKFLNCSTEAKLLQHVFSINNANNVPNVGSTLESKHIAQLPYISLLCMTIAPNPLLKPLFANHQPSTHHPGVTAFAEVCWLSTSWVAVKTSRPTSFAAVSITPVKGLTPMAAHKLRSWRAKRNKRVLQCYMCIHQRCHPQVGSSWKFHVWWIEDFCFCLS